MVNKTWMYNARHHKLLSYRISENSVILVTDKEWYEIPITKINKELSSFLPVATSNSHKDVSIVLFSGNGQSSLRDVVMDNITKLQSDPNYIKQAEAINKQVKTMIEMSKLKIKIDSME